MGKKNAPPNMYKRVKKDYPDFIQSLDALATAAKKAGPLEEKTVQLIQLGAAAAIRSEGAVHSHARRAMEAGAKPKEIRQSLLVLGSMIGFPNVIAALSWVDDVLSAK